MSVISIKVVLKAMIFDITHKQHVERIVRGIEQISAHREGNRVRVSCYGNLEVMIREVGGETSEARIRDRISQ